MAFLFRPLSFLQIIVDLAEVFSKEAGDTIEEALQKRFLQGLPANNCHINTVHVYPGNEPPYPDSYSVARISHLDFEEGLCPISGPYVYRGQEGIIFFLADSNHPTKFVFVNNGPSGLSSGEGNSAWYNTIRFLDIH